MECRIVSNGLGLFGWIRDGVKQSVLMGVSDAIDTIGAPEDRRELNPALLAFARQSMDGATVARVEEPTTRKVGGAAAAGPAGRKRLGRSLRDIDPAKPVQ